MVAELLGVTLGPKGRNVVLPNKYGPPKIVNDGETVLKEVFFFLLFIHHQPFASSFMKAYAILLLIPTLRYSLY